VVVTSLLTSATVAQAQGIYNNHIVDIRPEVHLDLFFHHHDLGIGARLDIPLVENGFIDSANDEFAISPGIDILFLDGFGIAPLVAFQWNFYLGSEWSVFPELGLAVIIHEHHDNRHDDDFHADVDPLIAIGGRYHFNNRNALVLRIGWPGIIQFGVTF